MHLYICHCTKCIECAHCEDWGPCTLLSLPLLEHCASNIHNSQHYPIAYVDMYIGASATSSYVYFWDLQISSLMNYTSLYHAYEIIVLSCYLSFYLHLSLSCYLTNICYALLQLHRRPWGTILRAVAWPRRPCQVATHMDEKPERTRTASPHHTGHGYTSDPR